ncbi:hypothetical protein T08_12712 [Trichinella sp. T8]|nr:hypothetical protein T08_12712 [Trichinella sp. T8]
MKYFSFHARPNFVCQSEKPESLLFSEKHLVMSSILTCGGLFCLGEFFGVSCPSEMRIWKRPFVRIPLVVDVVLCIRYERSDQSVSIVLFSKDDRNIATKRPAALKLRSA